MDSTPSINIIDKLRMDLANEINENLIVELFTKMTQLVPEDRITPEESLAYLLQNFSLESENEENYSENLNKKPRKK